MNMIKLTSRQAIIEAGFETFSQRPGASLADVAARAGVGRATLHRHFRSRGDLMVALAREAMVELEAAVGAATADAPTYTEGLRLALAAIIPLADRQWFLAHEPVEQDPDIARAYQQDRAELAADIEAAKAEGGFAKDIPTPWIAETYENLIYAAWTLVRNGEATSAQAADLAWRTLTRGLEGGKIDR
ncbi:MAG: TetR/AcrR family transcriptional regulator [Hyphomicrobiaceae bacterium]|nr:TetR/AcrR family transcriptional regulator [Hyphomicrobiaceae bacterium]